MEWWYVLLGFSLGMMVTSALHLWMSEQTLRRIQRRKPGNNWTPKPAPEGVSLVCPVCHWGYWIARLDGDQWFTCHCVPAEGTVDAKALLEAQSIIERLDKEKKL